MRLRLSSLLPLLAAAAGAISIASPAAADRLEKDACEALKTEAAGLVTAGAKTDMQQGPEWAKTNLAPERLQQIARLIEVEEQIAFRCKVLAVTPVKKKGKGAKAAAVDSGAAEPSDPGAAPAPTKPKPSVIKIKPATSKSAVNKPPVKRTGPPVLKVRKAPVKQKTGLFNVE